MNAVSKIKPDVDVHVDPLAKLREPFPPHQISKLPKESKKQADERKAGTNAINNCPVCGGWHHKNAVHLDYVGHAALTDRLLDTDPQWTWEPMALRDGLPAFDASGGLWIRLTVCGVTRLGYGHATAKPNMDAGAREKEVIGDALRNAAMRFGAALDLWHKGDLHPQEDADAHDQKIASVADMAIQLLRGCGDVGLFKEAWAKNAKGWNEVMEDDDWNRVVAVKKEKVADFVAEAEAAKAKAQPARAAAPAQVDPFDDEIPF